MPEMNESFGTLLGRYSGVFTTTRHSSPSVAGSRVDEIPRKAGCVMCTIPKYLLNNRRRIRNLVPQSAFTWSKSYDGINHPLMERLRQKFPDRRIDRKDLIALYQNWSDPALALIATLVWGGIDTSKKKRLQAVLATPENELHNKMRSIRNLVRRGLYEAAFLSCVRGGVNEINGIGPSYFTKMFFFVGQASPRTSLKPLILDKWTLNAFFALSYQAFDDKYLPMYFSIPSKASLDKYRSVPLKNKPLIQASAYSLYISMMNYWAGAMKVPADKLEQFVFGKDLRRDSSQTNPRNEILHIVQCGLSRLYTHPPVILPQGF